MNLQKVTAHILGSPIFVICHLALHGVTPFSSPPKVDCMLLQINGLLFRHPAFFGLE